MRVFRPVRVDYGDILLRICISECFKFVYK